MKHFREVDNINKYYKFNAWLQENGISQTEVADLLGVTRITLNRKINGTGSDFSLTEVRKICSHYSISANDFFINNLVSKTK